MKAVGAMISDSIEVVFLTLSARIPLTRIDDYMLFPKKQLFEIDTMR
jgi:hypothetical protein